MKIFLYDWEEKFLFPSKLYHISSYDDLEYVGIKHVRIENEVDQNRHANVARTCSSIGVFSKHPTVCTNLSESDSRNPLERQKTKKTLIQATLQPDDIDPFLYWLVSTVQRIPKKGGRKHQFVMEDTNYRMIMIKFGFLDFSFNPSISIE